MMKRKKKAWSRGSIDSSPSPLLTPEQVAEYLNISTRTLANWRSTGSNNLPYTKIGRCIRYKEAELNTYIEKHSSNSVASL